MFRNCFCRKKEKEWDEPGHFDKKGLLKENDKIRQQEIQELFPNFKFIRIRATFNLYRLLEPFKKKLKLIKQSNNNNGH